MFFTLLLVTFVLSLLVSVILVRAFNQPIERILSRRSTNTYQAPDMTAGGFPLTTPA